MVRHSRMNPEERKRLQDYWQAYADAPTIQSMMLNGNAADIDEPDRNDVLSGLPDNMKDMSVLEIGAGIGRFTKALAERSQEVLATDFIDTFIAKNQELHQHMGNVSFMTADAVSLVQDPSSRDMVFTNWLLMYLTDEEVATFFLNAVRWLRPGGYLHMRESCTESSTRSKSTANSENPTHYRHVSEYLSILRAIRWTDQSGHVWALKPLWSRSINTYVYAKDNWRQCQMLIRKVPAPKSTRHVIGETAAELVVIGRNAHVLQDGLDVEFVRNPDSSVVERILDMQEDGMEISHVMNLAPKEVDSFEVAKQLCCSVTAIVDDPYEYAAFLTQAMNEQNKRVRFNYSCFSEEGWKLPPSCADVVILGKNILPGDPAWVFKAIKSLVPDGQFMLTSFANVPILDQLLQEVGVVSLLPSTMKKSVYADSGSSDEETKLCHTVKQLKCSHSVESLDSGFTEIRNHT